ncbi:hypothetical protein [Aliterella atlantica]|uniref:Uncharacterized protein n=1 Tax=Aliterella atlantica CENA595 TaxID=1618023 RepID=A0A0D8ZP69_9CYAN|nr:hypothetical protein [Aliterella atlantica]KJH70264.1 hypothetical protein UH38_19145 [Aliterella atlantica CENA595]
MSKTNKDLLKGGNGINPKHFIYLDRSRLFSYTAQFSDGLPQLRHLLESVNKEDINSGLEQYNEEVREISNEVEGSVGAKSIVGSVTGTKEEKKTQKRSTKDAGATAKYEALQALSEVKVEHDNLYLLLEEDLINAGLLVNLNKELSQIKNATLIKAKGVARFFDWEMLAKLYERPEDIWNIAEDQVKSQGFGANKNETNEFKKKLKSFSQLLRTFSVGNITIHIQTESSTITTSLNTEYLCMTLEQLRAGYIMPGDVELTIVGFSPKRPNRGIQFPGLAGLINMGEVWEGLVGQVDVTIDPIAIYSEIKV